MNHFITALEGWLGAAAHYPTLQSELEKTKDVSKEVKHRVTKVNTNIKWLDSPLANHKKDVSRLTTELAEEKSGIAKLEPDGTRADKNITMERAATHEASTAVLDLEGQVISLTHQVEDVVRNVVAVARLRVDCIHNSTVG